MSTFEFETPFLATYFNEAIKRAEGIARKPIPDHIKAKFAEKVKSRFTDAPVFIRNDYKDTTVKTTLGQVAGWLKNRKGAQPVVTGIGMLFKNHSEIKSTILEMVEFLMEERTVAKTKMFDLMRSGLPESHPEVKALDQLQKILKLLANSLFGAYGEKSFHFYNANLGPAITYSGQLIISSTLYGFETFMTGNNWMREPDEMMHFATTCCMISDSLSDNKDHYDLAYWNNGVEPEVTRDDARAVLFRGCSNDWDPTDTIERVLNVVGPERYKWLVFRGNPYKFFELARCQDLLSTAISGEIHEADAKKIQKTHPEGKVALDELVKGSLIWVATHYMPADLPRMVTTMRRRIVTLTDTDSTFLNLNPWVEWITEQLGGEELPDDDHLTSMNCIIYILRCQNDFQMEWLTRNMGIEASHRGLILFKSEFIIKRQMLTDGKKHYAALQQFQEGVRLIGDKVELKGLSMKKTTVSRDTGTYLEKVLETRVLRPKNVDRAGMLDDIVTFEQRVREITLSGDPRYSKPETLGRETNYEDPYSQGVFRAAKTWNAIVPNNTVREASRASVYRSIIGTNGALLASMIEEATARNDSSAVHAYTTIFNMYFNPESELYNLKFGDNFNWICAPKELETLPQWFLPLIDIDYVIGNSVSPILPVLESTGIRVISTTNSDIYTNITRF